MSALESLYSTQAFATAGDSVAPGKVTGLTYTVNQGKVNLTWSAVTKNADDTVIDDLQGYRIFRKKTSDGTFALVGSVNASTTTYTDTGMKDGATYIYAVAAFDDEALPQEGEKSAELEVKTIPSVPTGLTATGFDGKIRLDWQSIKNESDSELNENLAGYNVYRSTKDGTEYTKIGTTGTTEITFEDSTVENSTKYYYVITSYDNTL
ncbi:fibronectin type III domain-containing protein [Bacillus thuringiensis]|uniref:fibronectin type III domain-containing protein n=1 Tax=Bacillus cereus group TaxID=86661 RepID=UPI001298941D|nr:MULTISPECIES: fibronectin type III domain-containing protein [Bacillus cereus group]MBJ7935646.1 fibronectin type III domain-containing protein [Bacillus cereus]MDR5046741.1 fibronectin type III domain-containing protein [Bacillus thuringiensis]MEB9420044.1 fibronectin type III domain-containing protein [Bacillus cereus]MRD18425.1 hypothetical protein [Bacillus thuringiensis]